jgi:hypothetical protein
MVSFCFPWRKLLPLTERLPLRVSCRCGAPGAGRAAPASGGNAAVCSKPLALAEDLPPAERLALVGPSVGRPAGANRRTGLRPSGDRWRVWASGRRPSARLCGPWRGHGQAVSEQGELEDDRSRPGSAPPGGQAGQRGAMVKTNRLLSRLWADSRRTRSAREGAESARNG